MSTNYYFLLAKTRYISIYPSVCKTGHVRKYFGGFKARDIRKYFGGFKARDIRKYFITETRQISIYSSVCKTRQILYTLSSSRLDILGYSVMEKIVVSSDIDIDLSSVSLYGIN
jgi:hypothetical protein